ncbi:MAG: hypothetical protein OEM26_09555 [Saprospiraceae bacterium]|nr:hypothetical protein [Saprospiraceae bacterium]
MPAGDPEAGRSKDLVRSKVAGSGMAFRMKPVSVFTLGVLGWKAALTAVFA